MSEFGNDEIIIKCEIKLSRIFYPKNVSVIESDSFAIISAEILNPIQNCPSYLKYIKLKGTVPRTEFGETYRVFCRLESHHEVYGDTYEIMYMSKKIDISSPEKQKEFLSNILNENIVQNLFYKYNDVIDLLENKNITALTKVSGIGEKTAQRLIDEYESCKDYSAIYIELGELGLTSNLIKKLIGFYHSPDVIVDVVKNNPYDLVRVDGIGFKKADSIALKMGIGEQDSRRVKGFMLHFLNEQGEIGKSYLTYGELMSALYETLGFISQETLNEVAQKLVDNHDVVVLDKGNKIALRKYYTLEKNIMNELIRLQIGIVDVEDDEEAEKDINDKSELHKNYVPRQFDLNNWEDIIHNVETTQGYDFTEEQLSAIKLSIENNIICLTGLAGSGKSSTANGICALYKNGHIVACALSGKAALRISETTGLPAATIHKTLNYSQGDFMYNKENKLAIDVLVIDESTMINGSLFLSLLEATPTGAKVIIMGDVQQLTPIGNCQIFADILDANVLPTVKLTKPHRQALRSGIIPTSIKVATQQPIFDVSFEGNTIIGELQDMELSIFKNKNNISQRIVEHFQNEMKKYNDVLEVQICLAKRIKGDLSCYTINNTIQEIYNPKFVESREIVVDMGKNTEGEELKYFLRVNDKVLNTKNNYNCTDSKGKKIAVFNGNIGIVKEILNNGNAIIDFIGIGEVIFTSEQTKNLELAYACTTHKLQGSQFLSVIVGIDNSSYIMNNSEWLYTAITRAKKYCVLCGENAAIRKAIKTKEVKSKQTFLRGMLVNYKNNLNGGI